MDKPTVAGLFTDAAKLLRAQFEYTRSSQPHAGSKGQAVEGILKDFLNAHLPRRFHATTGIVIDYDNSLSRQTDVIVYDALSSPIYQASEVSQIIPADSVAAAIQVKTSLDKETLREAYVNIASVKGLKKRPASDIDRPPTGSPATTVATLGIVFAFDSSTTVETLAENVVELNKEYASKLWPDMIVVLDKGVITYGVGFPGASGFAGTWGPPGTDDFKIPPIYIHPVLFKEGEFILNRFFIGLLSHLTFYPYRVGTPPFDVMLQGSDKQAMTFEAYQFGLDRALHVVPKEWQSPGARPPLRMRVIQKQTGRLVGEMEFMPWVDGAVVRWQGAIPLQGMLAILLDDKDALVMGYPDAPQVQLSSVLPIDETKFKEWPQRLAKRSDLTAEITTTS